MYRYYVISEPTGFQFMSTENWQTALDTWSELLCALTTHEAHIEVHKDMGDYNIKVKTLRDIEEVKKHSEYLMFLESDKENRVTKRLVQQEYDGMELVETKDEVERFDDYGQYTAELLQESYDDMIRAAVKLDKEVDFHGEFEKMSAEQQDEIINPKHYKMIPASAYEKHPDGLEYMDLMDYILAHHKGVESHLLGQVFKYAMRLGKKDADLQDAKKIAWYAERLVNTIAERD